MIHKSFRSKIVCYEHPTGNTVEFIQLKSNLIVFQTFHFEDTG